jgi:GT2 family glycosyltransferase
VSFPSISVLIVNYRAYAELDGCLASLKDNANHLLEIVVVDNGSLPEHLDQVAVHHPDVRFIAQQHNPGFAAAVNEGARRATGEYLLLLNPDTTLFPGAVLGLAGYLTAHSDVAIVGARIYDTDGTVQRSARAFPSVLTAFFGRTSALTALWPGNPLSRAQLVADESTDTVMEVDWVAGSCLLARASAFRAVGGLDERFFLYWEDADLCRRLRLAGWRIVYFPHAEVVHQVGRSSRHVRARSLIAFHRSAYRYYAKHAHGLVAQLALPVVAAGLFARMSLSITLMGAGDVAGRVLELVFRRSGRADGTSHDETADRHCHSR